jgi:hypothetical protein
MSFALSVIRLEEALARPGCVVCRMAHESAAHSIDSFLWESSNDPIIGKKIQAAYGFCPTHTEMVVANELSTSGTVLGVNQIYTRVAKYTLLNLQLTMKSTRCITGLRGWFKKLGLPVVIKSSETPLTPKENCPICEQVKILSRNTLSTLLEQLESGNKVFQQIYSQSSGVCLPHLRESIIHFGDSFPKGTDVLVADCSDRLETHRTDMLEYIRKQNWEYQEEEVTSQESSAWRKVLTFFTGYPEEKFTHHIKEF